jgi:hypothetical protein
LRRRFARFKLGAHLLDLRCLLFELRREHVNLFLLFLVLAVLFEESETFLLWEPRIAWMPGKISPVCEAIRRKRRSFTFTGFVYVARFPSAPFPPGTSRLVSRLCAEMIISE